MKKSCAKVLKTSVHTSSLLLKLQSQNKNNDGCSDKSLLYLHTYNIAMQISLLALMLI
jgi:hypothetical protein